MADLVDRDEARRLTEATVPGEWCYIPGNGIGLRGSTFLLVQDEGLTENNGRFIAAARQLVPALLGELDAATTALATARKDALNEAADAIQALHPGEVKNSVSWLRARADELGVS